MTGRHRGAHRNENDVRRQRVVEIVVIALVVLSGFVLIRAFTSNDACSGSLRITVAAPAEITSVIQATADAWAESASGASGRCVNVAVSRVATSELAAAIARKAGVTMPGVTVASATTLLPDIWIADSSTWLTRLRAAKPGLVPDDAPSIAASPVVLAVPEPLARSLGWPSPDVTWAELLAKMTGDATLKVGIVDPVSDASGLSGLLAIGTAAANAGAAGHEATVAAMRALVMGRAAGGTELLGRFPRTNDKKVLGDSLAAAPLSEQALIAYNTTAPAVPLAAIYPTPAPLVLDYPYVVMPGLDRERTVLAGQLRAALAGSDYRMLLGHAGLRAADGTASFPSLPGAPARVAATDLPTSALGQILGSWISATLPARMLAVMDVSGSMLTPVPTAGGATRGQISVAAARQGLTLFDNSWSVGLWTFSTELDGAKDYKELVPIGPMATQRQALLTALNSVVPKEGGETGLYDTVYAAYLTVQSGWRSDAINSIVLLTDGINRDEQGLTLPELLAKLKAVVDPTKPIQLIAIGIGDQVSEPELRQIVNATSGGVFLARDPSSIGEIFLKAIALRPPVDAL